MPKLGDDDPLFERFNAEFAAELKARAGHPENLDTRNGWELGLLSVDPVTAVVPALELFTEDGPARLALRPEVCPFYAIAEGRWAAATLQLAAGDASTPAGEDEWWLIELAYPLRPPARLGTLVTSAPLSFPESSTAAAAVVLGRDGAGLALDTEGGTDRWVLVPTFGYQLNFRTDIRRWEVTEMPTEAGQDDWASLLPST